jgi:hypothetical protein
MAHDEGLKSIHTEILAQPNEENGRRCIVKATIELEKGRFEGLGDADPGNVEDFLIPHLIRVAETRAKARALRDAVNAGVVSFEELDGVRPSPGSRPGPGAPPARRAPARQPAAAPRPPAPSRGGDNGADGPLSDAQRRYLFRLLAARGQSGKAAEEYLLAEHDVADVRTLTRAQASALIEQLLQTSAPGNGGGGNGAARPQR